MMRSLVHLITSFLCITVTTCGAQILFKDSDKFEGSKCITSSGEDGTCTIATECPRGQINLSRDNICSFQGSISVICCKLETSSKITVRPSEITCAEISDNGDFHAVFIGGEKSKPREHPHMAAIGWTQSNEEIDWKCGGSLIRDNYLLTAAHCARDREGINPDTVRIGVLHLIKNNPDLPPIDFKITEIIVHPQYRAPAVYNDIAILKLSQTSSFNQTLKPICLWTKPNIPVTTLLAMGYGTTEFQGSNSNELFQGNLNLVEYETCKTYFQSTGTRKIPRGLINSQICAQDPGGVRDTCQGDSGGPLQFKNDTEIYLVGITSFGELCNGPSPGVYTRVYSYIDWIESIAWA